MTRRLLAAALTAVLLALTGLTGLAGSAHAVEVRAIGLDCKESPTPDMPGQGLA